MSVSSNAERSFGSVDGHPARAFGLDGGAGVSAVVTDYGARLVQLHAPDRSGRPADVVLGFDSAQAYAASPAYFGATVGRYGNRIRRGEFSLRGQALTVDCNEGANHLHGGRHGWDSRVWEVEEFTPSSITFTTTSADGEMGFPGMCRVRSSYTLTGNRLRLVMEAAADRTTVVNMVHHSYLNLAGHAGGDVLAQVMRIPADFYLPVDDELLPTGEVRTVAGTPYDFRDAHPIAALFPDLPPVGAGVFSGGGGYDHCWCLRDAGSELREGLEVVDPGSGRRMRMWTTEPGLQMYTGGYLDESIVGKGGVRYRQYAGFTLETQKFPDAPRFAHFPSSIVEAGQTYRQVQELELTSDG